MKAIWWLGLSIVLCGCAVGPRYHRPEVNVPAVYKEAPGWAKAKPADNLAKGKWWTVYHAPTLDRLEPLVSISNQTLAANYAAYRQAQAIVKEARGGLFPTLTLNGNAARASGQENASLGNSQSSGDLSGTVSWVPDIWGKIHRQIEAEKDAAQVSGAALANATLAAQAALAGDYVNLRAQDALITLLRQTVAADRRSWQIARNQVEAGVVSPLDAITARTLLEEAQSQLVNAGVARAQYEHAIAVLIGKAPADFSLAPGRLIAKIPAIPVGVPSVLLQRRPDIAEAERSMAQANAQIGIALGAFYPDLTLTAIGGFSANPINALFSASTALWSLGTSASDALFDGGTRSAAVSAARAGYDERVAEYRQTILQAFQQVEDALSSLRLLRKEAIKQQAVVKDATRAVAIALNEYEAGTQTYTAVANAQVTMLSNQQTALSVQRDRLLASISLIQALGGGWKNTEKIR